MISNVPCLFDILNTNDQLFNQELLLQETKTRNVLNTEFDSFGSTNCFSDNETLEFYSARGGLSPRLGSNFIEEQELCQN